MIFIYFFHRLKLVSSYSSKMNKLDSDIIPDLVLFSAKGCSIDYIRGFADFIFIIIQQHILTKYSTKLNATQIDEIRKSTYFMSLIEKDLEIEKKKKILAEAKKSGNPADFSTFNQENVGKNVVVSKFFIKFSSNGVYNILRGKDFNGYNLFSYDFDKDTHPDKPKYEPIIFDQSTTGVKFYINEAEYDKQVITSWNDYVNFCIAQRIDPVMIDPDEIICLNPPVMKTPQVVDNGSALKKIISFDSDIYQPNLKEINTKMKEKFEKDKKAFIKVREAELDSDLNIFSHFFDDLYFNFNLPSAEDYSSETD